MKEDRETEKQMKMIIIKVTQAGWLGMLGKSSQKKWNLTQTLESA
jgi:hypothetical protein